MVDSRKQNRYGTLFKKKEQQTRTNNVRRFRTCIILHNCIHEPTCNMIMILIIHLISKMKNPICQYTLLASPK